MCHMSEFYWWWICAWVFIMRVNFAHFLNFRKYIFDGSNVWNGYQTWFYRLVYELDEEAVHFVRYAITVRMNLFGLFCDYQSKVFKRLVTKLCCLLWDQQSIWTILASVWPKCSWARSSVSLDWLTTISPYGLFSD